MRLGKVTSVLKFTRLLSGRRAAKLWHVLQDIVPHSCLWYGRWKYHWKSSCPLDVTYGSDALVIERWQRHKTEHVIDSWQILIPLSPSSTDVTDAMCTFSHQFSVTGFSFTTLLKMSLSSQWLHSQLASAALGPWWLPPPLCCPTLPNATPFTQNWPPEECQVQRCAWILVANYRQLTSNPLLKY